MVANESHGSQFFGNDGATATDNTVLSNAQVATLLAQVQSEHPEVAVSGLNGAAQTTVAIAQQAKNLACTRNNNTCAPAGRFVRAFASASVINGNPLAAQSAMSFVGHANEQGVDEVQLVTGAALKAEQIAAAGSVSPDDHAALCLVPGV